MDNTHEEEIKRLKARIKELQDFIGTKPGIYTLVIQTPFSQNVR